MKKYITDYKFSILIISLTYIPYLNVITWGGDYGHYILQAQNLFNLGEFTTKQEYLNSLTFNNRSAIYTAFGFPILLKISSLLHMWNLYYIKLITPICIGVISYLIYKKTSKEYLKLCYFLILLNPNINSAFKDIYTEFPALMFLVLGFTIKNSPIIKVCLFTISCIIRPTFIIFVIIDLIFESKKNHNYINILSFLSLFISINFGFRYLFGFNILGNYDTENNVISTVNSTLPVDIGNRLQSLLPELFDRTIFLISEIGRLFSGFTIFLNLIIGIIFLLLLITLRNKYSYMILVFMFSHLISEAPYYVRYFLPLLFITILYLDEVNFETSIQNTKLFKTIFLGVMIIFSILITENYINLDQQRGPHQAEAIEVIDYINLNLSDNLIAFHSPRVLRVLTTNDAYRYDKNFVNGSVYVCEKLKEPCVEDKFDETLFENKLYIILK